MRNGERIIKNAAATVAGITFYIGCLCIDRLILGDGPQEISKIPATAWVQKSYAGGESIYCKGDGWEGYRVSEKGSRGFKWGEDGNVSISDQFIDGRQFSWIVKGTDVLPTDTQANAITNPINAEAIENVQFGLNECSEVRSYASGKDLGIGDTAKDKDITYTVFKDRPEGSSRRSLSSMSHTL